MAGSAKLLGLLALLIASGLSYNGYLLYRAFRYGEVDSHYRVMLKDPTASRGAVNDLKSIAGVTVNVTEKVSLKRHNTGRWWLGLEMPNDMARQTQANLRAFRYNAIVEPVDQDKSVVHLQGDFSSESAAARARHGVSARVSEVITLHIVPAFHTEKVETEQVDLTIPDTEHLHSVQAVATRHNLSLEQVNPGTD